MNLFVTDECPVVSAHALDDKRVGKLLMEANQMLSLAIKIHGGWQPFDENWDRHVGQGKISDGFAHRNHPVSIWVRKTRQNFLWTLTHAEALADEFEYRFEHPHASAERCSYINFHRFERLIPEGPRTAFQNSARNDGLGVDFSHLPVPISYREYLMARWPRDYRAPVWTRRGSPSWAQL